MSRRTPGKLRRIAPIVPVALLAIVVSGCTLPTFGAYRGVTTQAQDEFKLWSWMCIAGAFVLVLVLGLIIWSCLVYRRKSEDHFPRQFHSNTAIEILYTVIPFLMIAVIFWATVVVENTIDNVAANPAVYIKVTGFQWGWKFQYYNPDHPNGTPIALVETSAEPKVLAQNPAGPEYPQFELPVGRTVHIELVSNDVVHTFYIPQFNFGRYALPGVVNNFDFTPVRTGVFDGKCAQYCGLYHSEMLFSVRVASEAAFNHWMATHATGAATSGLSS